MQQHTGDLYAVARLNFIHEVVVRVEQSCVRRLACRHLIGRLLKLQYKNTHATENCTYYGANEHLVNS